MDLSPPLQPHLTLTYLSFYLLHRVYLYYIIIMFNVYICVSQELLSSRKSELKITEEIIHEKDGEKENLEKRIEATRRRQSYVEKKIVEKVMFEKPAEKK